MICFRRMLQIHPEVLISCVLARVNLQRSERGFAQYYRHYSIHLLHLINSH